MYKQIIVIQGIKMSRGKTAVQVAHASLSAALKASNKILKAWQRDGEKKVVLKADLKKITSLIDKCQKLKIPCSLIRDAGRTELRSGTVTALGIGPDLDKKIDKITGSLPLLR